MVTDYTASVFEITPAGIVVHYEAPDKVDKFAVTIRVPEDVDPTPAWLQERIEAHSAAAMAFWDTQDRGVATAARLPALRAALSNVSFRGRRDPPVILPRIPEGPPGRN